MKKLDLEEQLVWISDESEVSSIERRGNSLALGFGERKHFLRRETGISLKGQVLEREKEKSCLKGWGWDEETSKGRNV